MMIQQESMHLLPAAAYVRGVSKRCSTPILSEAMLNTPLSALSDEEIRIILTAGMQAQLKLYRFKRHDMLPRVRKVMGFLKAIEPQNLLDVGSGRGVFLYPFLEAFPWVPITSLDILSHRAAFLKDIALGGIDTLTALEQDICSWGAPDRSFDVVTLLEVLEHIPDVQRAVNQAVRIARRFVIVTVPSKPDHNPEHIHLLTKEKLTELFGSAGCSLLSFDGVLNHLILIASIQS